MVEDIKKKDIISYIGFIKEEFNGSFIKNKNL